MINKIRDSIKFRTQFTKNGPKYDLVIYDDYLPAQGSPWRIFEFNELISNYPNSIIYSEIDKYKLYDRGKSFNENLKEISQEYINLQEKIIPLKNRSNINCRIFYTLFYRNINRLYPHLKLHKTKYAFTLYPGGEFIINNDAIDSRLKQIINDELCEFVIVNQKFTYNYLVDKLKVNADKINLIFGVPLDISQLNTSNQKKTSDNTNVLRSVFVGNKYMNYGLDKGLDTFLNVAHLLSDNANFKFSVIGNFTKSDNLIGKSLSNVDFIGKIYENELNSFLGKMDLIISPNRMNTLYPGAFDGFPLASAISGALQDCCMLLSNPTNEASSVFVDGKNFILINNDFVMLSNLLLELEKNRTKIQEIAANGKKTVEKEYSYTSQIKKRLSLFDQIIQQ